MKLRNLLLALGLCAAIAASAAGHNVVYNAADSSAVRLVGRSIVEPATGAVTFNWAGTYIETLLDGKSLSVNLSDTGKSYFDVFVDGKKIGKFKSEGTDTTVTVVEGLPRGVHRVTIAKRTEGETGTTTFNHFVLPQGGTLKATEPRERFIEFIGDSLSAGFGTEGESRDDPFTAENENTLLSFSTIIPRYFDADYAVIAHSGRGVVRNYGDPLRQSEKGTMSQRYDRALDADESAEWDFSHYTPQLVVINLGANDFMTEPNPYRSEFVPGYVALINRVIEKYGRGVKVLCVIPYAVNPDVESYYAEAIKEIDPGVDVRLLRQPIDHINATTDRGAVWHPNYQGQLKMAMLAIPYIATMMDWPIEMGKPVL